MKRRISFLLSVSFCFLALSGKSSGETLDEAIGRFLDGQKIEAADLEKIVGGERSGPSTNASRYLTHVKVSILDPKKNGGWPFRSPSVLADSKTQWKTYTEIKAMYEKEKTPLLAYTLVCPAMYVDDMELLPELIAKIAENRPLKELFDENFAKWWKPRLNPEL